MEHIFYNPNLNYFLPDRQIECDLAEIIWKEIPDGVIEIDEEYISIPANSKLEVIAKSYRQNTYEGGFGNHYATLVAIGGVVDMTAGIPHPQYCYATLFYSSEKYLITVDFHSRMR